MKVRADFSKAEKVRVDELAWLPSPLPGVERRMLDRVGDEVARATSIVRYQPNSHFDLHVHDLGEEFLVLDGTFSDEHGHYPAGTYVRNPPGSSHRPYTEEGCTIFVKLRQFEPDDDARVVINTQIQTFSPGLTDGLTVLPLHEHGAVSTAIVRWSADAEFQQDERHGGEELLVVQGVLSDDDGDHPALSWLRRPPNTRNRAYSREGCVVLVKLGHLQGLASTAGG